MPDIQQKTINSEVILFDPGYFNRPNPELFSYTYWQANGAITGQAKGRGTTYFFGHNQQDFVLRHYRRGGLIGKLINDKYLYTGLESSRPWQEFKLMQHMRSLGLPCPTPIAAKLKKSHVCYQADIITGKIPHAQDLHQRLLKQKLSSEVWQNIGQTIAQFHNQQIYHHDLNIHNIMLDNAQQAWLIDFDKCSVRKDADWKHANIQRLKRSFEKERRLHAIHWFEEDWLSLLNAYTDSQQ